jgi:hypothetical protein
MFNPTPPPINLAVSVVRSSSQKSYVLPGETIAFQITSSTPEAVTYRVTFGDSSQPVVTADSLIGHSWSIGGQYTVNVTATTRSNVQSQTVSVTIEQVKEGVKPENVSVKADWDRQTDFGITAYLQVSEGYIKGCINYDESRLRAYRNGE